MSKHYKVSPLMPSRLPRALQDALGLPDVIPFKDYLDEKKFLKHSIQERHVSRVDEDIEKGREAFYGPLQNPEVAVLVYLNDVANDNGSLVPKHSTVLADRHTTREAILRGRITLDNCKFEGMVPTYFGVSTEAEANRVIDEFTNSKKSTNTLEVLAMTALAAAVELDKGLAKSYGIRSTTGPVTEEKLKEHCNRWMDGYMALVKGSNATKKGTTIVNKPTVLTMAVEMLTKFYPFDSIRPFLTKVFDEDMSDENVAGLIRFLNSGKFSEAYPKHDAAKFITDGSGLVEVVKGQKAPRK